MGGLSIPTGFTFSAQDTTGITYTAAWNTPSAGTATTEVWTSSDGITFNLAGTVAVPGTSFGVLSPLNETKVFCKIRACSAGSCSAFTSVLTEAVVARWAQRVIANGSAAVSLAILQAVDTFWQALMSAGIDSLMITANVIAPTSRIAARTPLLIAGGNDPWVSTPAADQPSNLDINGWHSTDGLGGTQILNTGVIPSGIAALTASNGGLTLYMFGLGNATNGNFAPMGCYDVGNRFMFLDLADGAGSAYSSNLYDNNAASSAQVNKALPPIPGYYSGNRTANNSNVLYFATSTSAHASIATSANVNATTPPTIVMAAVGQNHQGTFSTTIGDTCSFAAMHSGLTAVQSQSLFNAVQALRTSFGGGFL